MCVLTCVNLLQVCLSVDINDAWKAQSKDFPWAKDMKYIDVMNLTNDAILAGVKFGNLYGVSDH